MQWVAMSESISAKKTEYNWFIVNDKRKREGHRERNVKLFWLKDSLMWLFNMNQSTHPFWLIFKWKYGYLITGWGFTKLVLTLHRYAQCSSEHSIISIVINAAV